MTTKRESYLQGLHDIFSASAELQALDVRIERSVFAAVSGGEGPALVVGRHRDIPVDANIGRVTRNCIVTLSAVIRGNVPETVADAVFAITHPLVMGFDADGLVGITEASTDEPQTADLEGGLGVLTMQYIFEYQTAPNAL